MRVLRSLQRVLAAIVDRARFERDLRDELREHVRQRPPTSTRRGLSPAEASRRARIEFGALEAFKEQCRDAGGMMAMRPWLGVSSDFKLAARRLAATPLFLAFAVLSLAIGVAVPTTVYSTLYELMWRPVGVERPARRRAGLLPAHSSAIAGAGSRHRSRLRGPAAEPASLAPWPRSRRSDNP